MPIKTWSLAVLLAALLPLGACSIEGNRAMQTAPARFLQDHFTKLNGERGPSIALLKQSGLKPTADHYAFVDAVVDASDNGAGAIQLDASHHPPIDYTVCFERITNAFAVESDPSLRVFQHPIIYSQNERGDPPKPARLTASGIPAVSGSGGMTAWRGNNLLACNESSAYWLVIKPRRDLLPLFFVYFDSLDIGGPIQLTICKSATKERSNDAVNLGIFFLDSAASGNSYEIQPGELCNGYPVLRILRKDRGSSLAATLIFSTDLKQYEVVGASEEVR